MEGGSREESSASSEQALSPNFITFLGEYLRCRLKKSGPARQISASDISEELSAELGRPSLPLWFLLTVFDCAQSSLLLFLDEVRSSEGEEPSLEKSKDLRREGGDGGTLEDRDEEEVPDDGGLKWMK